MLERKSCRKFDSEEIDELLALKPPLKAYGHSHEKSVKNLEDHHLFVLLYGHPHAIAMHAPYLQNHSLADLYKSILAMFNSQNFQKDLTTRNPTHSLKMSMDISIQRVREENPDAILLFCLIGLLPGGITASDLSKLWQDESWYPLAEYLSHNSLLVEKLQYNSSITNLKERKYLLLPFMNKYAESLLNNMELRHNHLMCC